MEQQCDVNLWVVKVLDNRTENFNIIGGIFDSQEKAQKFVVDAGLYNIAEIESFILNNHYICFAS